MAALYDADRTLDILRRDIDDAITGSAGVC